MYILGVVWKKPKSITNRSRTYDEMLGLMSCKTNAQNDLYRSNDYFFIFYCSVCILIDLMNIGIMCIIWQWALPFEC